MHTSISVKGTVRIRIWILANLVGFSSLVGCGVSLGFADNSTLFVSVRWKHLGRWALCMLLAEQLCVDLTQRKVSIGCGAQL